MKLQDKITIITGASSGMGKAMAKLFTQEGAIVYAIDLVEDRLHQTVEEIKTAGGHIIGYTANVTNKQQIETIIDDIITKEGKINILINNAGIMDNMEPVGEITDETWNKVMTVNLYGPMMLTRKVIPQMLTQGGGTIINTASIGGLFGCRAGVAYTSSKHALIGLTKNTAYMYADQGIRCNAICPGAVMTNIAESMKNISPMGGTKAGAGMAVNPRMGEPHEIAQVALFLASDDASFLNGSIVTADGGWTAY